MEFFQTLLFGVSGLSIIFWVCVMAMWHVDMFPRIFAKDPIQALTFANNQNTNSSNNSSLPKEGALRPDGITKGLIDRGKFSRKSIVVADFAPAEAGYSVNRLYTSILLSLGVMSFMFLSYGLQSGLRLPS